MSMPMLVSDLEPATPIAPMLRLADDVLDDADELAAAEPNATAGVRLVDGRLIADDAAALPAACVVCGDTVGAIALVTPRGRVGFSLCRDHLFSAIARVITGAAVVLVAAGLLVKGGGGTLSKLATFVVLASAGAGLIASAVPVWTWRGKDGQRRLFRVHRDVVRSDDRYR